MKGATMQQATDVVTDADRERIRRKTREAWNDKPTPCLQKRVDELLSMIHDASEDPLCREFSKIAAVELSTMIIRRTS